MSEEISREEIAALLARESKDAPFSDEIADMLAKGEYMSEEMTREQARDTLRNAAWLGTNEDRDRIERAVELLCGEPCSDAISRQALLEKSWDADTRCGYVQVVDVGDIIDAPPVQPISRWIPVGEKLPEEGKTVIASTKYGVYPEAKYTKEYGWEWAYEAGADYWVELENVTAWMPLPKQYSVDEPLDERVDE